MLYQFLGDAVIGLFGLPSQSDDYVERSFDCARSLLMLGNSVSNEWQRQLDRIQPVSGSHIGMAMGDLHGSFPSSLQPYPYWGDWGCHQHGGSTVIARRARADRREQYRLSTALFRFPGPAS